jgi:molybdopterin molybdotransferase
VKSVDQHLADLLSLAAPLRPFEMHLLDAHDATLAQDVHSSVDLPPWDNSAMDGYAVQYQDLIGATYATPVELIVDGDIAAGAEHLPLVMKGRSLRIMTGAPIPPGCDAVVPVEWTDGGTERVLITRAPVLGQNMRVKGSDIVSGTLILQEGVRLHAAQLAIAAAVGLARLPTHPHPRVVLISTGDELIEPGLPLAPGQIYESNSWMLAGAAREAGARAFRVETVPDNADRLMRVLEDQLVRADLVVTTGGVSKGAYDTVKEVLQNLGTMRFETVAMQPGMPQGFGTIGPDFTPIVTLPGNPVSAYVSFEVFVRPMIRQMLGLKEIFRPTVRASMRGNATSPKGKRSFLRAVIQVMEGRYVVTPVEGQGSHMLGALARANALIVVPEEVEHIGVDGSVEVMMLSEG